MNKKNILILLVLINVIWISALSRYLLPIANDKELLLNILVAILHFANGIFGGYVIFKKD